MLAVVSSSAMAEWVLIAEDKEETFTVYADPATIQKTGNTVKMWSLDDHKMAQEPDVVSSKSLDEYDCKKKQSRPLFLSAYSGHMTEGETVFTYNERSDWQPAPSGSVSEALLEKGILVTPIRPPAVPNNTSRLRITFSALHEENHIDILLDALSEVCNLI